MKLDVLLGHLLVGTLEHDPATNRFAFAYAQQWLRAKDRFALSPQLPLFELPGQPADAHSAAVRQFFENLLPEGQALDAAASSQRISKSNLMGLLVALGGETAGALRLRLDDVGAEGREGVRPVSDAELSERIRLRPQLPFSVWDGKVRLSIAGFQDKMALYRSAVGWAIVEGVDLASTHILKPEPVSSALAGLTSNEFVCMRLAKAAGLPVAPVELIHVPEPILVVTRFDRSAREGRIERLHIIDGCQALGLSSGFKYERPYGDGRDVRLIRDGASLPRLFALLADTAQPAAQRLQLLRWAIFQVLIGNTDAHAKNLSFFSGPEGLSLAPAYDLVCALAFDRQALAGTYAMAIGDAFSEDELCPYEWANFAETCGLNPKLVGRELTRLAKATLAALDRELGEAIRLGAKAEPVATLEQVIRTSCRRQIEMAPEIPSAC